MTQRKRFQSQSIEDWLFYLEQQHPSEIELGLDRVKTVAEKAELGNFGKAKVVLVAGTNGKGTTIRFMESYLIEQGYKVGIYSSPHLFKYNERVRLQGQDASDELHLAALSHIEKCREETPLTFFEFGTLAGLSLLQHQNLDFVLVEVGLGGRLDATNILNHDVSVVTSIGLDHVDWLGDDLNTIAFEKAGIFRSGTPAIIGEPVAYESFAEQANSHNVSALLQMNKDFNYKQGIDTWSVDLGDSEYSELPLPLIPIQNVATALVTLRELGVKLEQELISKVLSTVSLTGRLQILSEQPMQMVDVAHNSHAIKHLLKTLDTHPKFSHIESIDIVLAMMKDKDIQDCLALFEGKIKNWYLGDLPNNPRAASAQEIQAVMKDMGIDNVTVLPDIEQAWRMASENQSGQSLLLGLGSFYTVAEILSQKEV